MALLSTALILSVGGLRAAPTMAQSAADAEAAQRLYLEADRLAQAGDINAAIDEYGALVNSYPLTVAAADALLTIARLRFDQGQLDDASNSARQLVENYPQTAQAADAQIVLARVAIDEASDLAALDGILTELKRMPNLFPRDRFPTLSARSDALVLAGDLAMLLADIAGAASSYLEAIESEPPSAATARARLGYARSLLLAPDADDIARTAAVQMLQSAIASSTEGDSVSVAARDLLTLVHRHWIRPRSGQPIWTEVGRVGGLDLRKPRGVAGGPQGRLAITDSSAAYVMGPEGVESTVALRDASRPWFDRSGDLLLTTRDSVQAYPSRATESFTYRGGKPQELDKLEASARGVLGHWFLLDRGLDPLAILTRDERTVGVLPSDGSEVADFALGPMERIYVLAAKSSRVLIYGPDFEQLGVIAGSWQRPTALDVDALGNVYVFDRASASVSVHGPDGQKITGLGPSLSDGTELRDVEDIAVDAAGRLLLVDSKIPAVLILE